MEHHISARLSTHLLRCFGLLLLILASPARALCFDPTIQWQQGENLIVTSTPRQFESADGGWYVFFTAYTMTFSSTGPSGFGENDVVMEKRSATGELLWQRYYGGESNDGLYNVVRSAQGSFTLVAHSLSSPSGNKTTPYYGGLNFGDAWILRVDANGEILWQTSIGGTNDDWLELAESTTDGGLICAGQSTSLPSGNKEAPFYGDPNFGSDVWVVRLDAQGRKLWDKSYGGAENDTVVSLMQLESGELIIGALSSSGASGNKTSPRHSTGEFSYDYWLLRLNAQGGLIWERSFGYDGSQVLGTVLRTKGGGFLIAGTKYDNHREPFGFNDSTTANIWLVSVDAEGGFLWEQTYGGNSYDVLLSAKASKFGGYILGGATTSPPSGNKHSPTFGYLDCWFLRIDERGNINWENTFGAGGSDYLADFHETEDGGLLVAAGSDNVFGEPGNKTSPNYGSHMTWLFQLNSAGQKIGDWSLPSLPDAVPISLLRSADGGWLLSAPTIGPATGPWWLVKFAPEDCDHDGVPDIRDACPISAPGSKVNSAGCSIEDLCPCEGPWKNHGAYVSQLESVARQFRREGVISEQELQSRLRQAAQSNCGKR